MKSLIVLLFIVFPGFANATASASASITNFHLDVIGSNEDINNDSVFISSFAANDILTEYNSSTQSAFDIASSTQNSNGYSKTSAKNGILSLNLSSDVNSILGYAVTDTYVTYSINYLANTLLSISADAFISVSTSSSNDFASAFANLSLRNADYSYYKESTLTKYFFSNGNQADNNQLVISYLADKDSTLFFTAEVSSNVEATALALPIPEPETNMMMILGLLIIYFMSKRDSTMHANKK